MTPGEVLLNRVLLVQLAQSHPQRPFQRVGMALAQAFQRKRVSDVAPKLRFFALAHFRQEPAAFRTRDSLWFNDAIVRPGRCNAVSRSSSITSLDGMPICRELN